MKQSLRLVLILAGLALGSSSHAQVKVGDLFPEVKGRTDAPAPSIDGAVAIVDFWASWCAPCKASFPAYARLNAAYASKGLSILAVSVDEDPADFDRFVARFSPPFSVFLDRGHDLVRQVSVPTMPTCYVIDRNRRVRFIHAGYHGSETDLSLRKEVELLISEKPLPANP
jgi:thiol-disulfide isomerase/thioredoxin